MAKKISVLPPIEQDIAALTGVASGHDGLGLRQEDRVKCLKARNTMIVGGLTGLMLGLGVGSFLSFKLHRARKALLANFKAHSRPTHVVYGNGKYGMPASTRTKVMLKATAQSSPSLSLSIANELEFLRSHPLHYESTTSYYHQRSDLLPPHWRCGCLLQRSRSRQQTRSWFEDTQ